MSNEHDHQVALMGWAKNKESEIPELGLLFAVPNGGKRDMITAVNMKREGVKPGVPDLFLPVPRGAYHGLFVEMKHGNNRATPEQTSWMAALENQGYETCVAYSWQEASESILAYLQGRPVLRKATPLARQRAPRQSQASATVRRPRRKSPSNDAALPFELDPPL